MRRVYIAFIGILIGVVGGTLCSGVSAQEPPVAVKNWEPRWTPQYDQYLIKRLADNKTYASEEEAQNILKKKPKDWKAFSTLAQFSTFKEDWQNVFKFYRESLRLYPENYIVEYKLATFLLHWGKTDEEKKEAIQLLKKLSKGHFYQETRNARLRLRELGFSTPDPEAEFEIDSYGKKR